jgi:MtN3 and saliva related transmembrane protein
MEYVTYIGFAAATLTTIAGFPQLYKTWKTKHTKDISVHMFALTSAGVFLWLIYGLLINNLPLIIANTITFAIMFSILLLKLKHG